MTFDEYLVNWYRGFVGNHMDDDDWCKELFHIMNCREDYMEDGDTYYSVLSDIDDEERIWYNLFVDEDNFVDDLPDMYGFLKEAFKALCTWLINKYGFAEEFLDSYANECSAKGCIYPSGWFQDLQESRDNYMIDMFADPDDSYRFYLKHMDSLEAYKESLEIENGTIFKNTNHSPHAVFVCRQCYRDMAMEVLNRLWSND